MEDGKLEIMATSQMSLPFEEAPKEVPEHAVFDEVKASPDLYETEISSWTFDPDFMKATRELGADCGMDHATTLDFMQDMLILMEVFKLSREDVLGSVTRTRDIVEGKIAEVMVERPEPSNPSPSEVGNLPREWLEFPYAKMELANVGDEFQGGEMEVHSLTTEELLELSQRLNGTFPDDYSKS